MPCHHLFTQQQVALDGVKICAIFHRRCATYDRAMPLHLSQFRHVATWLAKKLSVKALGTGVENVLMLQGILTVAVTNE